MPIALNTDLTTSNNEDKTMECYIIVCINRRSPLKPSCAHRGSEELAVSLENRLQKNGYQNAMKRVYCLGNCKAGPNLRIAPGGPFFESVSSDQLDNIFIEFERFKQTLKVD